MIGETDVLVVGAGPVGCALAVQLRTHGVECVVVDREPDVSNVVRAQNVDMRTMEHLRRFGIAARLRERARIGEAWQRDIVLCASLHGPELGAFRAYGWRPEDARDVAAEPGQCIPQEHTNRVLCERAAELGATLLRSFEWTALEQRDGHVTSTLIGRGGETRQIRSSFVAGCDGGRSGVREAAGIARSGAGGLGQAVHLTIRAPGLFESIPLTPAAFYIVFGRELGGLAGAIAPGEFAFHLGGFETDEDTSGLDLDAVARTIIGRDLEVEVLRAAPYSIHELIADTFRSGQVFLAGDAAHLFCPYGGYNMNTGIGDAVDLGWKLAGVLAGWGGDALLDSYTAERRRIALERCAEATFNVRTLVAAFRDEARLVEALSTENGSEAEHRELGQRLFERTAREWITEGMVLDQRYRGSPVVADDGSVAPAHDPKRYQPFAKPGHRAPHAWLSGGRSLYDLLRGRFTLLVLGPVEGAERLERAAADRGLPLDVLRLEGPELLDLYGAPLLLVRPDQHVAWRGQAAPSDPAALIDVVRGAGHSSGPLACGA